MTDTIHPTLEADFTFAADQPFRLTGGGSLGPVTLRYALYGHVAPNRDNVVLVCHALSGSARVFDWWPQFFGPGRPFDLDRFAILGINVLGSCYGSTGPTSINEGTGQPFGSDFPVVSIRDMVGAQARLVEHLGIDRLYAVVGGSIGGMQALTWAIDHARRVARCVVVGAAPLSAMALALNHLQRQAIRLDPAWQGGRYGPDQRPTAGLALARAIAMCSYKSAELFQHRFGRKHDRGGEDPTGSHLGRFDVGGYLDHQGRIFNDRFDANSYLVITRAMDTFELGASPDEQDRQLCRIKARMLLVGIRSDWLFPPADVRALAMRMAALGLDARHAELDSTHGHDGFLADAADLVPLVQSILDEEPAALAGRT